MYAIRSYYEVWLIIPWESDEPFYVGILNFALRARQRSGVGGFPIRQKAGSRWWPSGSTPLRWRPLSRPCRIPLEIWDSTAWIIPQGRQIRLDQGVNRGDDSTATCDPKSERSAPPSDFPKPNVRPIFSLPWMNRPPLVGWGHGRGVHTTPSRWFV